MNHPPRDGARASSPWRRVGASCVLVLALALAGPALAADPSGVVNLNTATATELERLPGVGAKRAGEIISLRERLGGFDDVEALLEVRGIGEKALAKMRPYLALDGETTLAE